MIELLMARAGLSRAAALAIAGFIMLAIVANGVGWGLAGWRGMLSDARASGRAERDAHWRAEIAASNLKAEAERADAARRAGEAEARLAAERAALTETLARLEAANAALPNADACGLDRDRVRLLPR